MKKKLNSILMYTIIGGLLVASGWLLNHYGMFNNWFKVSAIIVKGNRYTPDENIIKKSGIKIDDSLYSLNLDSCNTEIMNLPYIKGVTISRYFPNQLIINVSEHQPIASVWEDKQWFLISHEGSILPLFHDIDLGRVPVLSGLKIENEKVGNSIHSAMLLEAYKFVNNLYINNPVTYAYSGEINFSKQKRIEIFFIKSEGKLIISKENYYGDLAKFNLFIRKGENLDFLRTGKYIDLCFKDRVIIKKA